MTSKELVRRISWMPLIGTVALCVGLWGPPEWAEAKEFVFVAQELGKGGSVFEMGETEIWLPNAVIINQKEDLNEPVWFIVKNPTGIDHEFAIWGLYMLVPEEEAIPELKVDPSFGGLLPRNIPMPIHLTLKAGETKKIQVAPRGLAGEKNLGARYPFFCPRHKDIRISGYVYVD
jgi:hypothetical protein